MKQFNKDNALRKIKLKQNKNTYIKKLSIPLSCLILIVIVMLFTFAKFEISSEEYTLISGKVRYSTCEYSEGQQWLINYSGSNEVFDAKCKGSYLIELWGASGGRSTSNKGLGGYTSGILDIKKGDKLYFYVGGQGKNVLADEGIAGGGYNGGGNGTNIDYLSGTSAAGGGGATDVRIFASKPSSSDLLWNSTKGLNSRIMVAAGGGGKKDQNPGSAGGLVGYDGSEYSAGKGGTQTSGGSGYSGYYGTSSSGGFGFGGAGSSFSSGGGSGYYGGGAGARDTTDGSGGGGSSYISGHTGCIGVTSETNSNPKCPSGSNKSCSESFTGYSFYNTKMIDGEGYSWTNAKNSIQQMPKPIGSFYDSEKGHNGDGYARITYMGKDINNKNLVYFDATGGSVDTSIKVLSNGENYGELPTPRKDGREFLGWYTEKENGTKVESNTVVNLSSEQTLYAHWKVLSQYTMYSNGTFSQEYKIGNTSQNATVTINSNNFVVDSNEAHSLPYLSMSLDLTDYKTLYMTISSGSGWFGMRVDNVTIYDGDNKWYNSSQQSYSSSQTFNLDVSSLNGNHTLYFACNYHYQRAYMTITNIYLKS